MNAIEAYKSVSDFSAELSKLLERDAFLARSDYRHLINNAKSAFDFFRPFWEEKEIPYICNKHGLDSQSVEAFMKDYLDLKDLKEGSKLIKGHNDAFLIDHLNSEESYLDKILAPIDKKIMLDEDQRRVVLSDEDYTLVVAGAGAGKTTTIAAKVRYLVERQQVNPDDILVISFTNKAVDELKDRIQKRLKIACRITTFHKTGYAILKSADAETMDIKDGSFLYDVVNEYLKEGVLKDPQMIKNLILFFGSYFEAPYEGDNIIAFFNYLAKSDFTTLKSNIDPDVEKIKSDRASRSVTINYEHVRSEQEVAIANFLYLNGVNYEYEKPYPYSFPNSQRVYTPDFTITQGDRIVYLEHFGITEDFHSTLYSWEELQKYRKSIDSKIALHKRKGTELLYTFSKYNDGRPLLEHLQELLEANGIQLKRRDEKEVYEKIVSTEENKYILKLVRLICTFIQNFKAKGLGESWFLEKTLNVKNVRTKLFLEVCRQCYLEYSRKLLEEGAVDFDDMINCSVKILEGANRLGKQVDYKYIIIDEYQDISRQRFSLAQLLSKISDAKIIAVGDDWQSIFQYAGSELLLFTKFDDWMGYGDRMQITRTYRNSQEVIDIAGNFILKNTSQISKRLISDKHINNPVIIESYTENVDSKETKNKGGKFFLLGQAVERCIEQILNSPSADGLPQNNSSILLIGRYGFDARNLSKSGLFEPPGKYDNKVICKKYPKANISFLTAHRAKGLGYDNVIIINAANAVYGFPSRIEDDPVMDLVRDEDKSYEYAEERRLFYVAMTRTKNRVYIAVPQQRPSRFVCELARDYSNVVVNGVLEMDKSDTPEFAQTLRCPICGYPLKYQKNKNIGLKLWLCTNEPEVCGFMTNDLKGGEMSILKCNECDGYLVVRMHDGHPFLGCTNYRTDDKGNKGCGRRMSENYYKEYLRRQVLGNKH